MIDVETPAHALLRFRDVVAGVVPNGPTAITIGKFDGVHVGHQALIKETIAVAATLGATPGVVTFDPLPYVVFNPGKPFHYLCTLEERIRYLRDAGAEFVVVIPFSNVFRSIPAFDLLSMFRETAQIRHIVAGPDSAIGKGREGTVERMREIGDEIGFGVTVLPFVTFDGVQVSSSNLRMLIHEEGNVAKAAIGLGRHYAIAGEVVHGDKRGRELGFPTANLSVSSYLIVPANGIYACWAEVDGVWHRAAVSIGVRPTFGDALDMRVEAFLLDFAGDVYGKTMRLEFVDRVRSELRFESVTDLIAQMNLDVATVRTILSEPYA